MKSKFLIKIKKLIEGKYFSTFQSIFKGPGLEVTDVRPYASGDALRHINWKTTAKYNELYTSLFQQEKEITLDVFFDINYNRKANLEKVIDFYGDMMVYCQKNGVKVHLFYPGGMLSIHKHRERGYEFIDILLRLVKKTLPKYQSGLSDFLTLAKHTTKRRAFFIISDFLDVEEEQKAILKYFMIEHSLSLIKIPVNPHEGQNYNRFVLDSKKAWDVEKLQTIAL